MAAAIRARIAARGWPSSDEVCLTASARAARMRDRLLHLSALVRRAFTRWWPRSGGHRSAWQGPGYWLRPCWTLVGLQRQRTACSGTGQRLCS